MDVLGKPDGFQYFNETAVNRIIRELYKASRTCSVQQFKLVCFELVGKILKYDSGAWITVADNKTNTRHTTHFYNQPLDVLSENLHCKVQNELIIKTLARPGEICDLAEDYLSDLYNHDKVAENYKIKHAIAVAVRDQTSTLYSVFTFFRIEKSRNFCESERFLLQSITTHIIESYKNNLSYNLYSFDSNCDKAVCDNMGVLHLYTDSFYELIKKEVPDWVGPWLPSNMIKFITQHDETVFKVKNIVIKSKKDHDLFHLSLYKERRVGELSASERWVTKYLLKGFTYKEVARKLSVSPSTVTNQVNNIYKKLNVRNKTELTKHILSHCSNML